MKKLIAVGALTLALGSLAGCSALDSKVKNWESNTKGLHRTVEVYSVTGEKLKSYEGKSVRVETENENNKVSVLIDNKRFSFNNATVIIEEK